MKKLQHIRLREGSKADQFLSGQLTSKYFSYQEIFAMLVPLIFDQLFLDFVYFVRVFITFSIWIIYSRTNNKAILNLPSAVTL